MEVKLFKQCGMPSFMTSKMEKANLKFIQLVEKYPCIWNRYDPNYTKKQEMETAWNEIAKEMHDTPKTCLIHWQKIRKAYSKSLKRKYNGTSQRSEYYLASVLEFVRPHLRLEYNIGKNVLKKEPVTKDSDDSSNSITYVEIKDEPDDSDGGATTSNDMAEMILFEIMKMEDESEAEDKNMKADIQSEVANPSCSKRKREDDSIIEVNKTKEAKEEDKIIVHPNSCLIDANRKFFESLIPFIDDMNTQQNRRFRREVMCLIDDVLDDRDIT